MSARLVRELADDGFSVSLVCRVLELPRSTYYDAVGRPPSKRQLADDELTKEILEIHEASRQNYGAPRVHAELRLGRGRHLGRKRIARLMRAAGIQGVCHRRKRGRKAAPPTHDDLVKRRFKADEPNKLWVTDITEHPTKTGKVYCCCVLDVFSRRIVGWAIADHMRSELVVDALQMATWRRNPEPGAIVHADRGSQGGFNRSSQHLMMMEVWSGSSTASRRPSEATEDAIARSSTTASRDPAPVLDRDRHGTDPRRSCFCSRRFAAGRSTLVPQCWRHATLQPRALVGSLPVVP